MVSKIPKKNMFPCYTELLLDIFNTQISRACTYQRHVDISPNKGLAMPRRKGTVQLLVLRQKGTLAFQLLLGGSLLNLFQWAAIIFFC